MAITSIGIKMQNTDSERTIADDGEKLWIIKPELKERKNKLQLIDIFNVGNLEICFYR